MGTPWFHLAGIPVYYPPALFWWWYFFDAYAPGIFETGGLIAASGGLFAITVAIGMSVWRAREAKNVATYGSARWATLEEIAAAGLTGADGVMLGRIGKDYPPRRPGTCALLRPDPVGQGRRPRGAHPADLAGLGHRP